MVSVEEVIRSTIVKCLLYLLGTCWNEKRSLIQAEQTHGLQLPLGLIRNANNANTLFANKLFLRVIETHISNLLDYMALVTENTNKEFKNWNKYNFMKVTVVDPDS